MNMDSELKAKIKAKLNVCVQAVNGMMQPDIDDEEKLGWISIYNGAMRKVMNEYLADDPEPVPEEPVEDVGGTMDSPTA